MFIMSAGSEKDGRVEGGSGNSLSLVIPTVTIDFGRNAGD